MKEAEKVGQNDEIAGVLGGRVMRPSLAEEIVWPKTEGRRLIQDWEFEIPENVKSIHVQVYCDNFYLYRKYEFLGSYGTVLGVMDDAKEMSFIAIWTINKRDFSVCDWFEELRR